MDSLTHRSRSNWRSALTVLALLILTEAVYMRPELLRGASSLMGSDYEMLHRQRLGFARQALLGPQHSIPAWNPHEMLGTPFAANLQSFPWIPTRLILLLLDPGAAFAAGVAIAAALAAFFTYLYCRRAGLSRIGAAAAGWTFAAAGYFSSRVMAGHLPLLEAYPALPLLLWLVDRALAQQNRFNLAALALCSTSVVAAGHPQVPAYAVASAFLYVFWTGRNIGFRLRARAAAAIALGIGIALAIWVPMLMLIGRSTRILHLAAPDNDVVMPYGRLLALVIPGIHGWADPVELADNHPFTGYPNNAYFWDTASYVGLLPLIAIAGLLIACLVAKRMPEWRWRFLAILGTGALIASLPIASPLLHMLPGTVLRSPARVLYISTFCAAVALGAAVDAVRTIEWPRAKWLVPALLAFLLALHFTDLWRFDRLFIHTYPREDETPAFQTILDREIGDGRVAEEREDMVFSYEDRYDDAGGFDSIFLAPYDRAYLALAGLPPDTNEQVFDASTLPPQALATLGVRFVITTEERHDLDWVATDGEARLYRVPNPAPRAAFIAHNGVVSAVDYVRPSSDEIDVGSTNAEPGSVRIIEAYDPGWKATVDGAPVEIVPADGYALAIQLAPGRHIIRVVYRTPGRAVGAALSLLSLGLLIGVIVSVSTSISMAPPASRAQ